MFEIVVTGIGVLLALFRLGLKTLKTIVFGGVTTVILAIGALVVPSFSGTGVFGVMFSRLLVMFTVLPHALGGAASVMLTAYGLLGALAVDVVGELLSAPYGIGIIFGVRYWAEPNSLQTIVHLLQ